MQPLATSTLALACRIFLTHSYPGGEDTIPLLRRAFFQLPPNAPIEEVLSPVLCQRLRALDGAERGYALRLGSAVYANLKLQAIDCDQSGTWVFAVDTHDALVLEPSDPDAGALAQLQEANRKLKKEIEAAWEAEGLLTFNTLLRRALSASTVA